jgi:hypothetical protein
MAQPIVSRGTITALSRLERGFESRWERHKNKRLPGVTKVVRGAQVPRNASVCDENLTRHTRVIATHGSLHILEVRDERGRKALRYVRDRPLA